MQIRKLVIAVIILVLLGGSALAREPIYLTLAEAEQMAMENSVSLRISRLALDEAQFNYRQADAAMIMRPSPVMLLQAQAGLDIAKQNHLMAQDQLRLTVQTDFYNVLKMQNVVQIAQEGLESAKRHEDIAVKQYDVGTATRLDVIKATRSVLNAQASLSQARHGLELSQMKFRQNLGVSLDAPIFAKSVPLKIEPVEIDLEEDITFALANRDEIKQLNVAVEVARKNVELAENDYTPVLQLEQAKINLAKMEAQLEQVKELLVLDIRQNFSAIIDARERITVHQKGIEEAEEMIRLSELSYEASMITSNDLADAQMAVLSAKNEFVAAVFDYRLSLANYYNAVTRALR